jgi:membrane protease YdiL (CAAX protease family)
MSAEQVIPPAPPRPDRPRATWRWWEALVIFFVFAVVTGVLALGVDSVVDGRKMEEFAFALLGNVVLVATVLVWIYALHRPAFAAIGFSRRTGRDFVYGMVSGLVIYIVAVFVVGSILLAILRWLAPIEVHAPRQIPHPSGAGQITLAAVAVVLSAPLAEELFFRAFLFGAIRARQSFWVAAVVSGAVFGAAHWQPDAPWQNSLLLVLVMVLVGTSLAWVYERRGAIIAPMGAHLAFNVIGFSFIAGMLR